mgnify:CR=1 FL=1
MPKDMLNEFNYINKNLNEYLSSVNKKYKGTDPLRDANRLYKEDQRLKHAKKEHSKEIQDPFEVYGFGIVAYFDLLRYLLLMFLIINLMFIPVFVMYYSKNVMATYESTNLLHEISLANIGQAGPECVQQYIGLDRNATEKLSCSRGKISDLIFAGIIPV